jgi:hypothetical protein
MEIIVIPKPIQVETVKAVPFNSLETELAIKLENNAESAITKTPQTIINEINNGKAAKNINGKIKQQIKDRLKLPKAIFEDPTLCAILPPNMQPIVPKPIIKKDQSEISKPFKL